MAAFRCGVGVFKTKVLVVLWDNVIDVSHHQWQVAIRKAQKAMTFRLPSIPRFVTQSIREGAINTIRIASDLHLDLNWIRVEWIDVLGITDGDR
jgi:hypothetical protein